MTAILEDIVAESERLLGMARDEGVPLHLLGGVAVITAPGQAAAEEGIDDPVRASQLGLQAGLVEGVGGEDLEGHAALHEDAVVDGGVAGEAGRVGEQQDADAGQGVRPPSCRLRVRSGHPQALPRQPTVKRLEWRPARPLMFAKGCDRSPQRQCPHRLLESW